MSAPNPPPESLRLATFLVREVLALLFVGFWLLLFAGELLTGEYHVPLWFHCVSVGVMSYALGVGVADLTAYRPPSRVEVVKQALGHDAETGAGE